MYTVFQLLLTRLRMLQGPGYPYEQVLKQYYDEIGLVMCAYLPQFQTFHYTEGLAFLLGVLPFSMVSITSSVYGSGLLP